MLQNFNKNSDKNPSKCVSVTSFCIYMSLQQVTKWQMKIPVFL